MTATTAETRNPNTLIAPLVHAIGILFGVFGVAFVYVVSDDVFVEENARNALNWHIPVSLFAIGIPLVGVLISELVGVALAVSIALATVCFGLLASTKAYRGEAWQYPIVPQLL